jgi:hypothetical protein
MNRVVLGHALAGGGILGTESGVGIPGGAEWMGLLVVPARNARLNQSALDNVAGYAEVSGYGEFALSPEVAVADGGNVNRLVSDWHERPPLGCCYYTVTSITCQRGTEWVCDLSVDEDESYCIGGHFVHNCRTVLAPIFEWDRGLAWGHELPMPGQPPYQGNQYQGFGQPELIREVRGGLPGAGKVPETISISEPIPIGDMSAKEWGNSISVEEERVIREWVEDNWETFRNISRLGPESAEALARYGAESCNDYMLLENTISRSAPYSGSIYRGLANLPDDTFNSFISLKPGETITLDSLQSATTNRNIATQWIEHRAGERKGILIEVVQNQTGIDISKFNNYGQREVLMRRGATYQVASTELQEGLGVVRLTEVSKTTQVKAAKPASPISKLKKAAWQLEDIEANEFYAMLFRTDSLESLQKLLMREGITIAQFKRMSAYTKNVGRLKWLKGL